MFRPKTGISMDGINCLSSRWCSDYSPLEQINTANVAGLVPAWVFQTGDVKLPEDIGETTYQVTPIKVGDTLFICTPHNWAIALDAATGTQKWKFDANSGLNPNRQHQTCRGVTYWRDPGRGEAEVCAARIYLPTADARLIALDAATGKICPFFADGGTLHLEQGMKYNPKGYYYSTSPPVAVAGKIIIGGAVNDNYSTMAQSGVIRAFDADTGALLWNWDSGNPTQTAPIDIAGGETYTTNSPNRHGPVGQYRKILGRGRGSGHCNRRRPLDAAVRPP